MPVIGYCARKLPLLLLACCVQARDLVARDASGTADPFCRLCLLPERRGGRLQSRVHRRTLCPEFEEEFVFDVAPSELARRTLEIVLLDYDRYSRDDCVGQVHCPLDQLAALPPNERVTLWKGFTAYQKQSTEVRSCSAASIPRFHAETRFRITWQIEWPFTARCTMVQSVVLRSHVVCPSVCLSVTLVDQDHIR